ncbi:transposase [Nitrosophilus labii]|uniref:transposase n=1 Tax=Nitrosophilus labii TaxID=2706014 RepID=UPI0016571141|nr:transposase [Nitrosophilus labii]
MYFSKEYGFTPILCKPYRAQTKGKVERFIGYVKRNFYIPLKAKLKNSPLQIDCASLNSQIFRWLAVTNERIHATTKEKPIKLFLLEQKALLPLVQTVEPSNKKTKNRYKTDTNYIPKNSIIAFNQESKSTLKEYDALLYQDSLNSIAGDVYATN